VLVFVDNERKPYAGLRIVERRCSHGIERGGKGQQSGEEKENRCLQEETAVVVMFEKIPF